MPAITVNASTTPARTQSRDDFNSNADAFVRWLETFTTELNIAVDDINAKAANVAAASATVAKWVSGTTYVQGDVRWSPANYGNYRRKTAGAGTTDPASDSTNWASVNSLAGLTLTGTTTLDVLVGTSTTDATSSTAAGTKLASGLAVAKTIMAGVGITLPDVDATGTPNISRSATAGLRLKGITGSLHDFRILNGSGAQVLNVPTGTQNIETLGSITAVGNFVAGAGVIHKSYTVATRPAHVAGNIIAVTDGGAGAVFQGSMGGSWVNLG